MSESRRELRKSTRINAGVPACRFSPSSSKYGSKSNKSTSSVRLKEIELKKLEAITKIQNENAAKQLQMEKATAAEISAREIVLVEAQAALEVEKVLEHSSNGSFGLSVLETNQKCDNDNKSKSKSNEKDSNVDLKYEDSFHISDFSCENYKSKIKRWIKKSSETQASDKCNANKESQEKCLLEEFTSATKVMAEAFQTLSHNKMSTESAAIPNSRLVVRELPIFNGNESEWPMFISIYESTAKLGKFSNEENIIRLQRALKGEAYETVKSLFISPNNLEEILNTLKSRFGRPEFIIESLINNAKRLPHVITENPFSLVKFANSIQNLTATTSALEMDVYIMNPQLLNELLSKLPIHFKFKWAEEVVMNNWKMPSLFNFSAWLKKEAEAAYVLCKPLQDPDKQRKIKYPVFLNSNQYVADQTVKQCLFCLKENHQIAKCRKFQILNVEQKWEWVKINKVCFSCLKKYHQVKNCRQRKKCDVENCSKFHNKILHAVSEVNENSTETEEPLFHGSISEISKTVLLRIVPITIIGKSKTVQTFALFDEGSTVTLIDADLAEEIGSEGIQDPLSIFWTNSTSHEEKSSRRINIQIRGSLNNEVFKLTDVRTIKNLRLPRQSVDVTSLSKKWQHLSQVNVANLENAVPKLLIGQDNIDLSVAREVIQGPPNAPILTKTKLGWVIHGNAYTSMFKSRVDKDFSFCMYHNKFEELSDLVQDALFQDQLGLESQETCNTSTEDQKALEIMNSTCRQLKTGHWEIGLLWKNEQLALPESKTAALKRLYSMEKKMDTNADLKHNYCTQIDEFLQKGYAKLLNEEEAKLMSGKTWFLPHFAVKHPSKPNKFRFVFDAKAKSNGVSFNENFLRGPDFLNSLIDILFKFRQFPIVVAGDIQEMFLQVKIKPEDRCSQKFLWRGGNRSIEPKIYQMEAMIFGSICSPSCAIFVTRKNAERYADKYPDAVEAINKKHYMDDYLDSFLDENTAIQTVKRVIEIHKSGGFNMRNWVTNSTAVLQSIPEQLRSKNQNSQNLELQNIMERVLGLLWNPKEDVLGFSSQFKQKFDKFMQESTIPSKKDVLRIVMSIYDPLGLLAPLTIQGRMLLQEIWLTKINWDERIPFELLQKWKKWLAQVNKIEDFKLPRCYGITSEIIEIQLHIFCDASQKGYAAAAYFLLKSQLKKNKSILVMGKSRVAPLKFMTIPKLELQAAVLGSKISKTIISGHGVNIKKKFFWVDSKICIGWINSNPLNFKTFVSNRITQILDNSEKDEWFWLPTKFNIADQGTRGLWSPEKYEEWFTGPKFLSQPENYWQKEKFKEVITEEQKKCKFSGFVMKNVKIFEFHRLSSYNKLVRAVAWVLRFISIAKRKIGIASTKLICEDLTVIEIERAELKLISQVQNESFPKEIHSLSTSNSLSKSSSLFALNPFLDEEGILRVAGRLDKASNLDEDVKHPIILEGKHELSHLIVRWYHIKNNHQGRELIFNELRQRFWILKARSVIRKFQKSCSLCRRFHAKRQSQIMGSLIEARVNPEVRAFMKVGMDYFGPMSVTIGRRHEKRYGVLFTCLATRAVHLELASSLSTDSAIMAIRRFICRRGFPLEIFSDNGTNLRGAEKEMKLELNKLNTSVVSNFCSTRRVQWHFNPPGAPHMGGVWERLIRSVKDALKIILNQQSPKEEVLTTLLVEAEHTVNSRPLTVVSSDVQDLESLTPNHFLIGKVNQVSTPGLFCDDEFAHRKQWRIAQRYADLFWRRWLREYVPTLIQRSKWLQKKDNLEEEDIVMIADENFPRNIWPMGKIIKTFTGKDGNVRVVDVSTKNGIFRRPIAKLILIKPKQN